MDLERLAERTKTLLKKEREHLSEASSAAGSTGILMSFREGLAWESREAY